MRFKILILFSCLFFLISGTPTFTSVEYVVPDNGIECPTDFTMSYTSHAAITITSDAEFTSQGFPGSGNETHPYIIEGYYINSSIECISIQSTSAYYVIRDCYLTSASETNNPALDLQTASHGTIESTYIENHRRGAYVSNSNNITFINTTIANAGIRGIDNDHCDSMMVNNSFFVDCTYGIYSRYNDNSIYFNNSLSTCDNAGIYTEYCTSSILNNSIHTVNHHGVNIYNSPSSVVSYNNITDCSDAAVNILNSNNSIVQYNAIEECSIKLHNSADCAIENNEISLSGVSIEGSSLSYWLHTISGNTVNQKPVGYFRETANTDIDGTQYGQVIMVDCENMYIENGVFDFSYTGSAIGFCDNVTIRNTSMASESGKGTYGIYCYETSFCKIINFTCENTTKGVMLDGSNNCTVTNCSMIGNTGAIEVVSSQDSLVTNNTVQKLGEHGIEVRTSDNVTVETNQISDCVQYGIATASLHDSLFTENTITGCKRGIDFQSNTNCNVSFNTVSDSSEYGVYTSGSDFCRFVNNSVDDSKYGIYITGCDTNWFYNNSLSNNGFLLEGSDLNEYIHTFENNTVNGKSLGYFESLNDTSIDGMSYGQFIIVNCTFFEVTGGEVDNATRGVLVYESSNCTVKGLSVLNNVDYGFFLYASQDMTIRDTIVENSGESGFYMIVQRCEISNVTSLNNSGAGFLMLGGEDVIFEKTNASNNEADGYYFLGVQNCTLTDAVAINNRNGFVLEWNDLGTITNCESSYNSISGISIGYCSDYIVSGNQFSHSRDGIYAESNSDIVLESNTCNQNERHGFNLFEMTSSTIENNYAYDNEEAGFRISWGDGSFIDNTGIANEYGFYFYRSSFTITGNNGSENQYGFYVDTVSLNGLENNTALSNEIHGFFFTGSDHLNISGNTASNNGFNGFYFEDTSECNITNNIILFNGIGIEFDAAADNNLVYLNQIGFSSLSNAVSDISNKWNKSTIGNYWSDYSGSGTYSIIGKAGDVDNHPMLMYQEPSINSPHDISFSVGETGYSFTWQIAVTHPTEQELFLNGTSQGLESYAGDEQTINLDGMGVGVYNLTLVVYDVLGTSASDTVIVTVIDDSPPTVSSPSDLTYEFSSIGNEITWDVTNQYTGYIIYLDDSIIDAGFVNGQTISISVDYLGIGNHNFTIMIYNDFGSITDTVFVNVEDTTAPTLNSPSDIIYQEYETGHTIEWSPSDTAPDSFLITRNGTLIHSSSWNGSVIEINVDFLSPGVYVYSLTVYDTSGHSAIDSVTVTVYPFSTTTTTTTTTITTTTETSIPTSTTNSTGAPPSGFDFTIQLVIGGIGAAVVLIIVLVFLKKKS